MSLRLPVLIGVALWAAAPVAAQHPRDQNANNTYPFGYDYSPWQPTIWSALDYRTKCEGEPIRGMDAGPIRWKVEIRNRTTDSLNFSYIIQPRGEKKQPAAKGHARAKPGGTFVKLASLPTTRCDDGITIKLDSVRVGPNQTEYLKPDREP